MGRPITEMTSRLDTLTMVLKSCKGKACINPWAELHPEGDVFSLTDSLKHKFDKFYAAQPRVFFTACKLGYLKEFEGPMEFNIFGDGGSGSGLGFSWPGELKRQAPLGAGRGHWSLWT